MGDVTSTIERLLRDRIASGHYRPGSRLPSERVLSADLGVGRTTIRLVLGKLTAAGLIEPQHGRGYFVPGVQEVTDRLTELRLDHGKPDALRWQTFGERNIYENEPWIRLNLVDVQPPGGGERFEHHVVRLFPAAIGIVANEADSILMMWRHRFVADQWGWEFPGGIVDDGEDGMAAVAREVEEETGWRPNKMQPLIGYQPMSGMVDSPHSVYFARGATFIGEPEATEESAIVEWIPRSRIPDLIENNLVVGSGSIVGLLHLLAFGFPNV
ncbi:GntR family transcriptional regulator [Actinoplanes sp. HUAS TT8]|uniref:GntR family transcriptional regulator n=1 Tax=Actinoplanes sp. HUAS TT8 TaxID=3447453 RepID=UPI003F5270DA